jgi:S1-C subfamily serine protease/tetratricopeptide (TPR) repeat protein
MSEDWSWGKFTLRVGIVLAACAIRIMNTDGGRPARSGASTSKPFPNLPPISQTLRVAPLPAVATTAAAFHPFASPDLLFAAASPAVAMVEVSETVDKVKQGSGFFVSANGFLVTNFHVIRGGTSANVTTADGRHLVVEGVAAANEKADLALLKVDPAGHDLPILRLAPGAPPPIGTRVFAIGNPRGLTNTLSDGLVSGMREFDAKTLAIPVMQTSAPISPGSSGGPLLQLDGTVIGVTTAGLDDGQNLNFAVPAKHVLRLMESRRSVEDLATVTARYGPDREDATASREATPIENVALLVKNRKYSDAMKVLREIADTNRDVARYWTLLGRTQEAGFHNYDVAEDAYRRAIKLNPDYLAAHGYLGTLLASRNRFDEALDCFRTQSKLDPTRPGPYRNASMVALKLARFPQALALIELAIQRDPADADLHMIRAQVFSSLNRDSEAMADFTFVLRANPQSSTALSGIGDLQLRGGKTAQAKETFQSVLGLYPLNQHAHLQLGRIAKGEGALRAALDEWTKVIAYDPYTSDGLAATRERSSLNMSALIRSTK